jgi:hypothetical protein
MFQGAVEASCCVLIANKELVQIKSTITHVTLVLLGAALAIIKSICAIKAYLILLKRVDRARTHLKYGLRAPEENAEHNQADYSHVKQVVIVAPKLDDQLIFLVFKPPLLLYCEWLYLSERYDLFNLYLLCV